MGKFVKGDVVVINFPFSYLSGAKRRPALVITDLHGDDVILCQITGRMNGDEYAIALSKGDFSSGCLQYDSLICVNKIFTADSSLIQYCACKVNSSKMTEVINKLLSVIKSLYTVNFLVGK